MRRSGREDASFAPDIKSTRPQINAFSISELLVVLAIMMLLMILLLPAFSAFASGAGRRGAVNIVMNTLEQSRVAALESGRSVYVVFYRRTFPERDSILVLREPENKTGNYEQLTRQLQLPRGILLHQPSAGQSLLSVTNFSGVFDATRISNPLVMVSGESLNVLVFNETGTLVFPAPKVNRKLILSEGVRDNSGVECLISDRKQASGGFEIISVSPSTGRAQLDVTSIQ